MINHFDVIGKKNNQTFVSDADREILTLGSTDNAKLRFRHYPFTLGFGFLGLHRRSMLDSIYLKHSKNSLTPSAQYRLATSGAGLVCQIFNGPFSISCNKKKQNTCNHTLYGCPVAYILAAIATIFGLVTYVNLLINISASDW